MANPWLAHVKNVRSQNAGMSFKNVLQLAKKSYKSLPVHMVVPVISSVSLKNVIVNMVTKQIKPCQHDFKSFVRIKNNVDMADTRIYIL